jgi:hypothetical protein
MISISLSGSSAYKASTGFARRLLMMAAVVALPGVANAQCPPACNVGNFFVLDNPGDPDFNQLLGINDGKVIVGYFGDGAVVANNGYVLVPQNHYSTENFTNLTPPDFASQTQAIGISNREVPQIVGFYTDNATGFTHGFYDFLSTQNTVDDPMGVTGITTPTQNLLGINDNNFAAGFWLDNAGHENGFVVQFGRDAANNLTTAFTEVPPSLFNGAVATQVSGITDTQFICGFWTGADGNSLGFFGLLAGKLTSFRVTIGAVTAKSTQVLGCNNSGELVGSFVDLKGVHGFIAKNGAFTQFDAPGSSQVIAFAVQGTIINGVNDAGDFVGFYSDSSKVHGFVNFAQSLGVGAKN